MKDAFLRILERPPSPVLEFHPDNRSESINHHMERCGKGAVRGARLPRSRPYQKNDNRTAEQQNATLVRAYPGHERLDTADQTLALNRLCDMMSLYFTVSQPVTRLSEKMLDRAEG